MVPNLVSWFIVATMIHTQQQILITVCSLDQEFLPPCLQKHHLEKLDVNPPFTFFAQKTPDSYLWHPFRHLSSDRRAQFFPSTWPTFAGLYQLGICVICLSFPARESQALYTEELILFHWHLKIAKGKGRILLTKMFLRETGKDTVFKLQTVSE